MNKRRDLFIVLGAAALAPQAVLAQSKQPILIGWLSAFSRESEVRLHAAFREALAALGWKEGTLVVFEERWAEGSQDRLRLLAEELAAKKPAVIVATPLQSVAAAAKAAPKIPIVQVAGADPVAAGLAASLARPGGMITGPVDVLTETSGKYLELLLAAAPKLRRIGFLADSKAPGYMSRTEAARRSVEQYAVEARFVAAANAQEIEPTISHLAKEGVQGLIVIGSPMLTSERRRVLKLALAQRWPVVAGLREWVEEGALLGHGAERSAMYRRAAYYVDRILKGAKPADLPIEQPTKFELTVNARTAKALGLTVPQSILVRADQVIE